MRFHLSPFPQKRLILRLNGHHTPSWSPHPPPRSDGTLWRRSSRSFPPPGSPPRPMTHLYLGAFASGGSRWTPGVTPGESNVVHSRPHNLVPRAFPLPFLKGTALGITLGTRLSSPESLGLICNYAKNKHGDSWLMADRRGVLTNL